MIEDKVEFVVYSCNGGKIYVTTPMLEEQFLKDYSSSLAESQRKEVSGSTVIVLSDLYFE